MMGTKVKELPSSIQHLPAYVPPPADRVKHSDIWRRAMEATERPYRVEFTKGF